MTATATTLTCLNCGKSEQETPLLHLRHLGKELWICSQCLPTLIHAPQKLTGKLDNAGHIAPAPHQKH